MKFQRLPGPVGQGYRLVEYISVARVRPRTSKGITDLLLPQTSLFVFHKSKNFTSDYEIQMPPTVPVNHYSDPEGQHNRIRILWCYPMLMYPERRLALSTLISSKLALQWILVKRFRLYSFQLPDSMSPVLLFIVTTSPCQDWVICAPAAFLGCGSRFSGSLSGIEP
ncbi:hypothetical protein VNO78_34599 [Psophocarpus tetragonolobus]|uniref:Uncharacterized protein n=1 Tax=Psophocarpus tetragonolobus TaxID=3891 RepID=A0AAN9RMC8_PSOTE